MTIRKPEMGALGKETNFDFQYIPALDLITEPGTAEEAGAVGGAGVESRNLKALLVASALVAAVAWLGLKAASFVLRTRLGFITST